MEEVKGRVREKRETRGGDGRSEGRRGGGEEIGGSEGRGRGEGKKRVDTCKREGRCSRLHLLCNSTWGALDIIFDIRSFVQSTLCVFLLTYLVSIGRIAGKGII